MAGFYFEVLLKVFIGCYNQQLLLSTFNFYLILFAQNIEEGFVLKVSECKPWQVDIGDHGDIKKDRFVVYKPESLHINTAGFYFILGEWKGESFGPVSDFELHDDAGEQIIFSHGRCCPRQ